MVVMVLERCFSMLVLLLLLQEVFKPSLKVRGMLETRRARLVVLDEFEMLSRAGLWVQCLHE
jgi:hypothetical protein